MSILDLSEYKRILLVKKFQVNDHTVRYRPIKTIRWEDSISLVNAIGTRGLFYSDLTLEPLGDSKYKVIKDRFSHMVGNIVEITEKDLFLEML